MSGGPARSRITIADGRSTCVYDMRFVYEDGEVVDGAAVDPCETGSYTLEEQKLRSRAAGPASAAPA